MIHNNNSCQICRLSSNSSNLSHHKRMIKAPLTFIRTRWPSGTCHLQVLQVGSCFTQIKPLHPWFYLSLKLQVRIWILEVNSLCTATSIMAPHPQQTFQLFKIHTISRNWAAQIYCRAFPPPIQPSSKSAFKVTPSCLHLQRYPIINSCCNSTSLFLHLSISSNRIRVWTSTWWLPQTL